MITRLIDTIADVCGLSPGELEGRTTPRECWTPMRRLMIASALESTYAVALDVEDMDEIRSLDRVRAMLERHGVKPD